jgi:hypothetical protein
MNELVLGACQAAGNVRGEAAMLRGLIDVRTWNPAEPTENAMSRLAADAARLWRLFDDVGDAAGASDAAVMSAWGGRRRATSRARVKTPRRRCGLRRLPAMSAGGRGPGSPRRWSIGSPVGWTGEQPAHLVVGAGQAGQVASDRTRPPPGLRSTTRPC